MLMCVRYKEGVAVLELKGRSSGSCDWQQTRRSEKLLRFNISSIGVQRGGWGRSVVVKGHAVPVLKTAHPDTIITPFIKTPSSFSRLSAPLGECTCRAFHMLKLKQTNRLDFKL